MRIALLDLTNDLWTASASFTRMLAHSLVAACRDTDCEVGILSKTGAPSGVNIPAWPLVTPRYFPGEVTLRKVFKRPPKNQMTASLAEHRCDVALPLLNLREPLGVPCIGWIPDFQPTYLPDYFSEKERTNRDLMNRGLVAHASRILLSSRDAIGHLAEVAPGPENKAEAIPFPSLFAFEPPPSVIGNAPLRYNLPKKFALIANQFWAHKNHLVVVEALRLLHARGLQIPLVCTGLPLDHRAVGNRPFSELLQAIAAAGLHQQIHVLGSVPFPDLVDLLRQAAVVIQPSRFEGWSTAVQDGIALGRPLICSDIAVHREQAPGALGFFGVDAPGVLAEQLAKHWLDLTPGPDLAAENIGLAREREFANEHGRKLLSLCRAAAARST